MTFLSFDIPHLYAKVSENGNYKMKLLKCRVPRHVTTYRIIITFKMGSVAVKDVWVYFFGVHELLNNIAFSWLPHKKARGPTAVPTSYRNFPLVQAVGVLAPAGVIYIAIVSIYNICVYSTRPRGHLPLSIPKRNSREVLQAAYSGCGGNTQLEGGCREKPIRAAQGYLKGAAVSGELEE